MHRIFATKLWSSCEYAARSIRDTENMGSIQEIYGTLQQFSPVTSDFKVIDFNKISKRAV